jgi:NAD(P)-dependent dehydrogenase (short-subunit alcohol dehydrogenase family)
LGRHAIVEELAGFGARVHTCARNAGELEACRRRWAEKGLSVTVSVCDVSVRADREKLVATVKGTFGGKARHPRKQPSSFTSHQLRERDKKETP